MDSILTKFVSRTKADPALAHDLLEATGWELEAALTAYQGLHDTHAVVPEDELDFGFDPSNAYKAIAYCMYVSVTSMILVRPWD